MVKDEAHEKGVKLEKGIGRIESTNSKRKESKQKGEGWRIIPKEECIVFFVFMVGAGWVENDTVFKSLNIRLPACFPPAG